MPIRQRGGSWQIDVRTVDGTRLRRNYATRAQAELAATALTPNPQARAEARRLRRRASARSKTFAAGSAAPSSSTPVISFPAQSPQPTSPESPPNSKASRPAVKRNGCAYARAALRAVGAPTAAILAFPHTRAPRPVERTVPEIEFEAVMRVAPQGLQTRAAARTRGRPAPRHNRALLNQQL